MGVTKHAGKRMKGRCGLNKKSVDRIAEKTFEEGFPHNKTKGCLNKWITENTCRKLPLPQRAKD